MCDLSVCTHYLNILLILILILLFCDQLDQAQFIIYIGQHRAYASNLPTVFSLNHLQSDLINRGF